jgi:SAM-dependent methyltransferase
MSAPTTDRIDGPERHLFGHCREVYDAGLPGTTLHDLYESDGARLYETFINPVASDLAPFVRLARRTGGPVLDLACGSGRVSFPLAQRGLEVTGVDLSADMLALLEDKAALEAAVVRDRLTLRQGDMTALAEVDGVGGRRFALITLGATSLVLLGRADERAALFAAVSGLLAPGGRFAFDLVDHDTTALERAPERREVWRHDDGSETLLTERLVRRDGGLWQQVNFLTEREGPGGPERHIVTTAKAVFAVAQIVDEVAQAGLTVVSRRRDTNGVVFLECATSTDPGPNHPKGGEHT